MLNYGMLMNKARSITETPNFLSADIDLATPAEIVRILRQADAQIFAGYLGYPGLFDSATIELLARLAERAARTLASPKGRIVISGAGTSGRLAMFTARVFNAVCPGKPFRYLIAGGDAALLEAQEGAEDDPVQGIADLNRVTADADDIFYVGVTCGLSAPYIAGQLEDMLKREHCFGVLLGFNPVELARNTPIEDWHGSFRDEAIRTADAPNAAVLNPVLGPEPVTGSTRMKSGSATKILLEVLFHAARRLADGTLKPASLRGAIVEMLRAFEGAYRSVYLQLDSIARLVEVGGDTLRAHGHIYYLGSAGGENNTGILGIVDASECPPTYGAGFEDVRGFVSGSWDAFLPEREPGLMERGQHFRIGIDDFRSLKMPSLKQDDLCVFVGDFSGAAELLTELRSMGARTAAICWDKPLSAETVVSIVQEKDPALGYGPLELQVKLVVNALTTGAHILAGKVFGNRMIDLRISNNKLFYRTTGIISDLMKVSPEQAQMALVRSVYETDALTDAQRTAPIREYIEVAKSVDKVVPKALLIATGEFTYKQAGEALGRNPIVRTAIEKYVSTNG